LYRSFFCHSSAELSNLFSFFVANKAILHTIKQTLESIHTEIAIQGCTMDFIYGGEWAGVQLEKI
jgi:hypothetical protein